MEGREDKEGKGRDDGDGREAKGRAGNVFSGLEISVYI
jgi:hypothetical protein